MIRRSRWVSALLSATVVTGSLVFFNDNAIAPASMLRIAGSDDATQVTDLRFATQGGGDLATVRPQRADQRRTVSVQR